MGAEGEARGAERTGHMALCFATDATVRIVTAATAEDADWDVGVPLRSHWNRELHGMEEKVSCFAWVWQRLGGSRREPQLPLPSRRPCLLPRAQAVVLQAVWPVKVERVLEYCSLQHSFLTQLCQLVPSPGA